MQDQNLQELNWFWKITTKWYFFPLFYLLLCVAFNIIYDVLHKSAEPFKIILLALYLLPNGFILILPESLSFFLRSSLSKLFGGEELSFGFPIIAHVLMIASISFIIFFSYKRKRILKYLIIALLSFMIISFVGCSINVNNLT